MLNACICEKVFVLLQVKTRNNKYSPTNQFVIMVQNLIGLQGNPVVNQFVIETSKYIYFQSYKSVICKYDKQTGKITLSQHWDYSTTTAKYLYKFLRTWCYQYVEKRQDVLSHIKNKEYTLSKLDSLKI